MPYIITNTSKGLNPKNSVYNKNINISLKNDEGGISECVIGTETPLILSGNYLPKEFHTLQIKGLVTITNISTEQFNFIKQEEEDKITIKEQLKVVEKEAVLEIEPLEVEITTVETEEIIAEKEIKLKKK